MPTVHSVSDITNILSGIIKNEPTFQEVWVTGKVSVDLSYQEFFGSVIGKTRLGVSYLVATLLCSDRCWFREIELLVNGKITLYASQQ